MEGGNFILRQSSVIMEKEDAEMMNVKEVALTIEWFKAHGLTDADVTNYLTYIATGVGLEDKEPVAKEATT